MDGSDYKGLIQAELGTAKELLKQAIEANDPVGILQMRHRIQELEDELLA